MNRRKTKSRYLSVVQARHKMGLITKTQADQFTLMFSRCRSHQEFQEVRDALHEVSFGIYTDTDLYARLVRESSFDDDE